MSVTRIICESCGMSQAYCKCSEERFHTIITEIYDNEGELVKMTNAIVPGDYKIDEMEQKYHDWLDERRKEND